MVPISPTAPCTRPRALPASTFSSELTVQMKRDPITRCPSRMSGCVHNPLPFTDEWVCPQPVALHGRVGVSITRHPSRTSGCVHNLLPFTDEWVCPQPIALHRRVGVSTTRCPSRTSGCVHNPSPFTDEWVCPRSVNPVMYCMCSCICMVLPSILFIVYFGHLNYFRVFSE